MPRAALLQMCSGVDPAANAATIVAAIAEAKAGGADMLFTPEMSNIIDRNRKRANEHVVSEDHDQVLAAARDAASREGMWVALGSLAIDRGDGRFANRAFVINPAGDVVCRYDKIHMFDVDLATGESWRESNAYAPGEALGVAEGTPFGRLGLAICYDIRFPALFAALGARKCDVIVVPAAFTVPTGIDHWHLMQRARAVEASAFVLSAAQVGHHEDDRDTYGHSLAVDPWGNVLLDMGGEATGLGFVDLDLNRISEVRAQLPSLANRREIPN